MRTFEPTFEDSMSQKRFLDLWHAMVRASGSMERPCELVRDQELQIRVRRLPRIAER